MTMRDGAKPEVQLGIWRLVVDKLIDRTGMSNKEFSVWASRILAEGGSGICVLIAQSGGSVSSLGVGAETRARRPRRSTSPVSPAAVHTVSGHLSVRPS